MLPSERKRRSLIDILTEECTQILNDLIRGLDQITIDTKLNERSNRNGGTSLELRVLFALIESHPVS